MKAAEQCDREQNVKRKLQTKLGQLSMERVPKWDIFFSQKKETREGLKGANGQFVRS